jgi:hypothetical protein
VRSRTFPFQMSDKPRPASCPWWVTPADILSFVLVTLLVWTLATGRGPVFHLAGVRVKMTSALRLAFWVAVVLTSRHLAFRRENLPRRIERLLGRARSRFLSRDPRLAEDDYLPPVRTVHVTAFEIVAVGALMLLLTVAMTYPQIARFDSVRDLGDPLFATWRLAWVAHQLPRDPLHLFDGDIYHPAPLTLAYSDSTCCPRCWRRPRSGSARPASTSSTRGFSSRSSSPAWRCTRWCGG